MARREPLTQERITEAAGRLIERDGLAALSMRGLARELGVEAMSLYHWFPSKDDLMDALVDDFAAAVARVEGPPEAALAELARSFRREASKRPNLFPYLAVHRFNTATAVAALEGFLAPFAELLPDPAARAAGFRFFVHWIVGFCLDETSGFAKGPSARNPPSDAEVLERFPRVAALGPYNRPEHFDALFEAGLRAVIRAIRELGATPAAGLR